MKAFKRIVILVLSIALLLGSVSVFAEDDMYSIKLKRPDHGRVQTNAASAKRRDQIKVYITPDEGYEVESVTVHFSSVITATKLDVENRYFFIMPNEPVYIKVEFKAIGEEEPAEGPKEEEPAEEPKDEEPAEEPKEETVTKFSDVPEWRYYYGPVMWALENKITTGKKGAIFDPNGVTSRAEMVTFLWRAAGSPVVNYAMSFEDVEKDSYYEEAVRWACSEGITNGYEDGTFMPGKSVTRGEAVTFLSRIAGIDASVERKHSFKDVKSYKFFNNPIAWAAANGIATGYEDGTFEPQSNCSRAQVVTFIYRLQNEYDPAKDVQEVATSTDLNTEN